MAQVLLDMAMSLDGFIAGSGDRYVVVGGGASITQQYLNAGLLDEIQIHLIPILLGAGIRLFDHLGTEPIELENTGVIEGPGVTHLRFRVIKGSYELKR